MASYQKATDNSWSVRFRIIDTDGKTIQKRLSSFNRKSDAERAYREFMASYVAPNIAQLPCSFTFGQLYSMFIEYKKSRVRESSIYSMSQLISKNILPYFGKLNVNEITKLDILKWQKTIDCFAFNYKSKLRQYVGSIFRFGMMYYDVPNNPILQVEPFKRTEAKKEMLIWSEAEFKQFISVANDLVYKTFFTTLYLSGCRKSELLAASWNDIDFNTGVLNINKSVTHKVKDKVYAITPPKNNSSIRKLLLPNVCLNLLSTLKDASQDGAKFIFYNDSPLAETTIKRKLIEYCKLSQVKIIRIHDFRHSHASLLINKGENILMVAKRLGHSDIEQTLNTYSHLMPNAEGEMVSKINLDI